MNFPYNRLPLLRPQNSTPQQFSSTPNNQRFFVPRFGHSSIPSYPRPRSSASKPNHNSSLMDHDTSYSYSDTDSMLNNYGSINCEDSFSNGNSSYQQSPNTSAYYSCNESFSESPNFPSQQKAGVFTKVSGFQSQAPVFQTQPRGRGNYRGGNRGFNRKRKTEIIPFEAPFQKQNTSKWHCDVCSIEFTSRIPYDMHMGGSRHARKLKCINIKEEIQTKVGDNTDIAATGNTYRCDLCNIVTNGSIPFFTHLEGKQHKAHVKKLEVEKLKAENLTKAIAAAKSTRPTVPKAEKEVTSEEPAKKTTTEEPAKKAKYACDICSVIVNSDTQLQQHLASKKHLMKVEGKPLPKKMKTETAPDYLPISIPLSE